MAKVLLFNIKGEKRTRILFLLLQLGLPCRQISSTELSMTLGELTGREKLGPAKKPAQFFEEEMLVMDGLEPGQFRALLDGLRRKRATVALKAIVTEQNLTWTAWELCQALREEHERFSRMAAAQQK